MRSWYDSLFQPVRQFASGLAAGAGIPRSIQEARELVKQWGAMLEGPTPEEAAAGSRMTEEALKDPLNTGAALIRQMRSALSQNPAGSAGVALGMALTPGPDDALKFGARALSNAERRLAAKEALVQRKLVEGYEGKTGPLEQPKVAPPGSESLGDDAAWAAALPDEALAPYVDFVEFNNQKALAALKELRKRGWRGDIADAEHVALENTGVDLTPYRGKAPTSIWTREEEGAKILTDVTYGNPNMPKGPSYLQDFTRSLGEQELFKDLPNGTTIMLEGNRALKGPKGWTVVGGKPLHRDFQWIFRQQFDKRTPQTDDLGLPMPDAIDSNPERAVELVKQHGGWKGLASDEAARKIVLREIRRREAAGVALPTETVWRNLEEMKARKKGIGWNR